MGFLPYGNISHSISFVTFPYPKNMKKPEWVTIWLANNPIEWMFSVSYFFFVFTKSTFIARFSDGTNRKSGSSSSSHSTRLPSLLLLLLLNCHLVAKVITITTTTVITISKKSQPIVGVLLHSDNILEFKILKCFAKHLKFLYEMYLVIKLLSLIWRKYH